MYKEKSGGLEYKEIRKWENSHRKCTKIFKVETEAREQKLLRRTRYSNLENACKFWVSRKEKRCLFCKTSEKAFERMEDMQKN